ncbi:MAG: cupin domain-containing protein [Pseudobdellovibrionaceae bacterium]
MKIVNLFELGGFVRNNYAEKYRGEERAIGSVFKAKNIGFHLEILDPKSFSCPYHYHDYEEEVVIAIEGEAIVRQNNKFRKIKAGDLVYYETGPESAHHMYNHTGKPFKYFVLSTKFLEECCHYPDSGKILDKVKKEVTQNGASVDYWKDEEDPSVHWPENALRGEV